jgi:hypothetical protein
MFHQEYWHPATTLPSELEFIGSCFMATIRVDVNTLQSKPSV